MKKKTALLLVIVMLIAMPMSAYAATDAEIATKVINDIMAVNNGLDSAVVIINDSGQQVSSQSFNSKMYPQDPVTGMPIIDVDTSGNITTKPTGPAVSYFTVSSSAITSSGAISADYETTSIPVTVTKPYLPSSYNADETSGLPVNGTYAVSIVDSYGNVVWVAYGFTNPVIPEGASGTVGTTNGLNFKGGAGNAGFADVVGTEKFTITAYALDAKPSRGGAALSAGFTLADFKSAIDGHVLAVQSLSVTYTK